MKRRNIAELKVSLLSKGINFDMDLFKDYKKDFYDNQFVYGKTSSGVSPEHRFPQVLVLGDGIISALLRRENSPWNVKREGDDVNLYEDDKYVKTVLLPEKPPYFGRKLSDGTPSESIIAVAGEDTPGFFFYPKCFYFSEGMQCGFCSMKSTRKTVGKRMVSEFTEDNVIEATKLFQKTKWRDIPLISITTGTPATDEETRKYVLKMIKAMHGALEPKIPVHVLAHPPYDLDIIDEYKGAGVTSIAFNLEVFDKELFEKICPGKHKFYGYDNWLKALNRAKDVFGEYNAFCGLLWGLEPTESTIKGNESFLERGIGIASNIFHADPQSVLAKYPHPTEENILRIAEAQHELYLNNPSAKTIFPVSMRSTIDWEIYRGDFL
jgi:hypothetical protein